jgi:hypothetical protein
VNESISVSWDALIADGRELGAALSASSPTPEIESMHADFQNFSRNAAASAQRQQLAPPPIAPEQSANRRN